MTQEILLAATIKAEALPGLLQNYASPPGGDTLLLVESLPQHIVAPEKRLHLLRLAIFQPDFPFSDYTSGRLFHAEGEIRWERQQAAVNIVYTGNAEYQPSPEGKTSCPFDLDTVKKEERQYFLFGKRLAPLQLERIGPAAQEGDFAEARIPRLLRYPRLESLAGAERIQIAAYEYHHAATGALIAYRFWKLKPEESKSA